MNGIYLYYMPGCPYCAFVEQRLRERRIQYNRINVSWKKEIKMVPVLILYRDGIEIKRVEGATDIDSKIDSLLQS